MDILVQRDVSDDEFEPVWARLDAYDSRYEDGLTEVYPATRADIHKHPTHWQLKGPRLNNQFDTLNTFKKKPHSSLRNGVFEGLRIWNSCRSL